MKFEGIEIAQFQIPSSFQISSSISIPSNFIFFKSLCGGESHKFKLQIYATNKKYRHRVETYRDVTDRCKHCGSLRFHVPTFFSGDRAKNDQLRVLSKFKVSRHQVVIQSDACMMHLVTCRACAQKKWVH